MSTDTDLEQTLQRVMSPTSLAQEQMRVIVPHSQQPPSFSYAAPPSGDLHLHQGMASPSGVGRPSPWGTPRAAVSTYRSCASCGELVVGPCVSCAICQGDVHAHCIVAQQGIAICHACLDERALFTAQQQMATFGHYAGALGRTFEFTSRSMFKKDIMLTTSA